MDRRASIRPYHAAGGGSASGQFKVEMGKAETVHGWGSSDCGCLSIGIRVDGGDSTHVREGAGDGWSLDIDGSGDPAYKVVQAKACTIALAVLTIYVVDFAINAGWCSACTEHMISQLMRKHSPVFVSKSHCRHSANCKAAARFCLGYAPLPCILDFTYIEILKQAG